jgi:hypothetical protein
MAQKTIYRISAMPQHGHIGCKTAHSAAKGQSYWWNTVPGPAAVVSVCFNTATASCRCTVSDAHSSQGWHRQQVVHLQDTHRDEVKEKANNQQQCATTALCRSLHKIYKQEISQSQQHQCVAVGQQSGNHDCRSPYATQQYTQGQISSFEGVKKKSQAQHTLLEHNLTL